MNGDGYADLLVKHSSVQAGGASADRIYVYPGSLKGVGHAATFVFTGTAGATLLDAAPAGDVNGDGYADLLVHDQRYLTASVDVILGSAAGPSSVPALVVAPPDPDYAPTFGEQLVGAGDLNGDGFDDVVLYAERAPTASASKPPFVLFVYDGSSHGLDATPRQTIVPPADVTVGQATIARVGDVDGDGLANLIAGVDGATGTGALAPILVYHGGRRGLGTTPAQRLASPGLTALTGGTTGAGSRGSAT